MGCPPDDSEETPTDFEVASDYIRDMGYSGNIYQPNVGTFDDYYVDSTTAPSKVVMAWKDCTMASYTAYKSTWGISSSEKPARVIFTEAAAKIPTNTLGTGLTGYIDFLSEDNSDATNDSNLAIGFPLAENSIILYIYKSGN
jgi:hypothetical protein